MMQVYSTEVEYWVPTGHKNKDNTEIYHWISPLTYVLVFNRGPSVNYSTKHVALEFLYNKICERMKSEADNGGGLDKVMDSIKELCDVPAPAKGIYIEVTLKEVGGADSFYVKLSMSRMLDEQ